MLEAFQQVVISEVNEKWEHTIKNYLQEELKKCPRCLKDTRDFLRDIESVEVNEVTYLCTFDIQSLYTNIPLSEGCEV